MTPPTVAVTGSTGRLGGRVARRLAAAGVPQRLLVRDAARAPSLPGAQVAVASFTDTQAVTAALDGVDVVLMVSASETPDRVARHVAFLDAAAAAGAGHVVYVSFAGAAPDATFTLARDHFATEEHLRTTGLAWTAMRDNLYADFAPMLAGPDDVVRGPAGDGRAAFVAQDDIADALTAVLRSPADHSGRTWTLTGPAAHSVAEMAHALTAAYGRPFAYVDETLEEAYASRAGYGAPDWQLDAWVSTYTAIAAGELAEVTDHVEQLTGHPATPLDAVLSAAVSPRRP